jgi:signal transduction histidine kinase
VIQVTSAVTRHRHTIVDFALVGFVLLTAAYGGALEGAAFTTAMALTLLVRRRWPLEVFLLLSVLAAAHWLLGILAFGDITLLIAFYTVAAQESLRRTALAGAILLAGIVAAMVSEGNSGDDAARAIVALAAMGATAGALGLSVRSRRALLVSLRERAARLEVERDQQAQLAAANERARIARELHDVVAHNLSVMIALADGAAYQVEAAPDRARAAMETTSSTGRQALTEMRRLLGVLRDGDGEGNGHAPRAPQPGAEELEALVDRVRAAGMPVTLEREGTELASLPDGVQLAAYRIVQEALTNTLKHAGAGARTHVALRSDGGVVDIEVRDRGGRAAPVTKATSEGGGLRGMRERAAVYDGTVTAGPAPDGGWRVAARLRPEDAAA